MSQINKIVCIIVMWGLLIFVGYNVLTVEALEESKIKDACKKMDGDWKKGECKFEDGVEMGKPYSKEQYQVDFDHYIYDKELDEEIAAKEDKEKLTGYDEEGRQLNVINGDYDEEESRYYNPDGGEPFYEDEIEGIREHQQKYQQEEQIEDWGNTVSEKTEDEEQARDKVVKIMEESEEGNEVHGGAELEYNTDESEDNEEQEEEESDDSSSEEEESSSEDEE